MEPSGGSGGWRRSVKGSRACLRGKKDGVRVMTSRKRRSKRKGRSMMMVCRGGGRGRVRERE
eukprot:3644277-Rhodomonas_salina.4